MSKKKISRRKFLVRTSATGGVLLGAMYFGGCGVVKRKIAGIANTAEAPYTGNTDDPMIWFEVSPDNKITLSSPKVEMGQGTFTGMAQLAADELGVDIENIEVKHAASDSGNIDSFATGGSTSIMSLWVPLRELSATMRQMLVNHGAELLGAEPADVEVTKGNITAKGKTLTYGEIAQKVTEWKVPKTPKLKNINDYKYIGKPVPRVDLHDKVVGASIYGIDATMPDMLHGAVVRSTHIGSKYKRADISKAEKMPGVVKIVVEDDFVGVIANSYTEAHNAKDAIQVEWETDREWQTEDIEKMVEVGQGKPVTIQKEGSAKRVLANSDDVISLAYKSPIGGHAQLEPNGALAYVDGEKATVMLSTQVVKITRGEVADRLGISKKNVNIIPTFLGGGFGRRLHTPNAVQAAILSKAVGKPVKCYFSRKEEFQQDTFRPPTHHVLKAKMDESGKLIEAIEHNVSSGDVMYGSPLVPRIAQPLIGSDVGAWRGGMIQYSKIPHYRAVSWRVKLPFATSWWRALGLLANTFAIESFMDELAVKAEMNPVEFRLAQINDDERGSRLKKVIEKAAEESGFQDGVMANGRAMGFAASTDANTPVAQVVEVSIENNEIKVHKVTCVIDPGLAVNPDQIRAQCEGAIIMGMSASMYEKMQVVNGQLTPTIYGPYRMALMKNAPKEINVHILENAETPGAVGEPPLGPIGAAVANAVYRITGKRLREMPLSLG
ncbi:xanthine dehydrogenase family protein molybdopterin-binding subunit [Portibacter lacus]|uniref:Aldehyde oxidase n=1 Tax=Portibacter lacus TaxID=1099794 RepID=A0AA37SMN3_9BACT|nr:molybdopterin cofactor-binding domain-containing protein [Portibacter lacus]GLR15621.1 aldehyde oxidase [Portibacter lacus]